MREIKFRVWDGSQMLYVSREAELQLNFGINEGWSLWDPNEELCTHKDGELQQYTGLKDRNGKEIYEGDIVKVESTLVYPFDNKIPVDPPKKSVKYYRIGWHKSGCWNKFDGMSDEHKGIVGVNQPHIWCEVVGNIYQNPELIEGETKQ